jgi:SAM-dependent methyltransferase
MTYSPGFYDTIRAGVQSSAAVVVPIVMELFQPEKVIDVGCGEGWWAHEFAQHGCDVIGIDGAYVQGSPLGDRFLPHDLTQPLPDHLAGRFDMAVCLEVAEHLVESRAASFVADLCSLAPQVLFSAAIPHQTGAGHVNLKWPSWWAALFAGQGYDFDGSLRDVFWTDDRVEPWYRQNLIISTKGGTSAALDLVHPVIHGWAR